MGSICFFVVFSQGWICWALRTILLVLFFFFLFILLPVSHSFFFLMFLIFDLQWLVLSCKMGEDMLTCNSLLDIFFWDVLVKNSLLAYVFFWPFCYKQTLNRQPTSKQALAGRWTNKPYMLSIRNSPVTKKENKSSKNRIHHRVIQWTEKMTVLQKFQ